MRRAVWLASALTECAQHSITRRLIDVQWRICTSANVVVHCNRCSGRLVPWLPTSQVHAYDEGSVTYAGYLMRAMVLLAQGIYCNMFFVSYLISPKYCHRLVGYLEEEAVKTYTHLIHDLDKGRVPEWTDAPRAAAGHLVRP